MSTSDPLITYAQNREDLFLYALLGDVDEGFYVDIGANHPVDDSVTKFFSLRGWRGINVEPNKELHAVLLQDRPRDVNLNVGVSQDEGSMTFRLYPSHAGLSTFAPAIMAIHEAEQLPFEERSVPVTTLRKVLAEHGARTIDFMKIDVEGHEFEVLLGNDWERFRPKVLVIEGGAREVWEPLVLQARYCPEFFDGLNYYYVAAEERDRLSIMKYASRVLSRAVRAWREVEVCNMLEQQVAALSAAATAAAEPRRLPLAPRRFWARVAEVLRR